MHLSGCAHLITISSVKINFSPIRKLKSEIEYAVITNWFLIKSMHLSIAYRNGIFKVTALRYGIYKSYKECA